VAGVLGWVVAIGLGAGMLAPSAASAANSVYATNFGEGSVSTFSIGSGGALTEQGTGVLSGPDTSSDPLTAVVSPNGHNLYVANAGGSVSTFSIGPGGALTQQGTGVISGSSSSSSPHGLAVSPNGQNLYVTNFGVGSVSTFSIGSGGALTQQGTGVMSGSSTSSEPQAAAVSPNGQDLYVANSATGSVSTFSIGPGGALTNQGTDVMSGAQPMGLAVTPNGQDLYVANFASGTVSTFSIGSGGALTEQGTGVTSGSSTSSEPDGVAVSPNGQNLYVTNSGLGTVSTFSIGSGGALTQQGSGVLSGSDTSSAPIGVAVSPNGQDLYVANDGQGTVSTFSIGSGGAITQQGAPGVMSGTTTTSDPMGVVVSPDQGPSAAFSATIAPAGSATTFNAQASLAGSTAIAAHVWTFGDGAGTHGPLVSHVFASPGTYNVTLTLTDADACSVFGPFTGQSPFCVTDPAATTSQTITVPRATTTATIVSASASGDHVALTFACNGGAATNRCAGPVTLTSHVTTRGDATIGVDASVKQNKKAKRPKKTTVVKVASGSYSVATGNRVTVKLTLNSAGQKLLSRFYRLPSTVKVGGTTPITKAVAFSYGRIRSPFSFTWVFNAGFSVAQKLTITGLPHKPKVTVICHGGGCPFARRTFSPHGKQLALASDLKHRHLAPHTTLELEITAANDVGKVAIFTILSGQSPSLAERCLPPGARKPVVCAS
jgi:DNA-binding beta-propeller fold protein YncE